MVSSGSSPIGILPEFSITEIYSKLVAHLASTAAFVITETLLAFRSDEHENQRADFVLVEIEQKAFFVSLHFTSLYMNVELCYRVADRVKASLARFSKQFKAKFMRPSWGFVPPPLLSHNRHDGKVHPFDFRAAFQQKLQWDLNKTFSNTTPEAIVTALLDSLEASGSRMTQCGPSKFVCQRDVIIASTSSPTGDAFVFLGAELTFSQTSVACQLWMDQFYGTALVGPTRRHMTDVHYFRQCVQDVVDLVTALLTYDHFRLKRPEQSAQQHDPADKSSHVRIISPPSFLQPQRSKILPCQADVSALLLSSDYYECLFKHFEIADLTSLVGVSTHELLDASLRQNLIRRLTEVSQFALRDNYDEVLNDIRGHRRLASGHVDDRLATEPIGAPTFACFLNFHSNRVGLYITLVSIANPEPNKTASREARAANKLKQLASHVTNQVQPAEPIPPPSERPQSATSMGSSSSTNERLFAIHVFHCHRDNIVDPVARRQLRYSIHSNTDTDFSNLHINRIYECTTIKGHIQNVTNSFARSFCAASFHGFRQRAQIVEADLDKVVNCMKSKRIELNLAQELMAIRDVQVRCIAPGLTAEDYKASMKARFSAKLKQYFTLVPGFQVFYQNDTAWKTVQPTASPQKVGLFAQVLGEDVKGTSTIPLHRRNSSIDNGNIPIQAVANDSDEMLLEMTFSLQERKKVPVDAKKQYFTAGVDFIPTSFEEVDGLVPPEVLAADGFYESIRAGDWQGLLTLTFSYLPEEDSMTTRDGLIGKDNISEGIDEDKKEYEKEHDVDEKEDEEAGISVTVSTIDDTEASDDVFQDDELPTVSRLHSRWRTISESDIVFATDSNEERQESHQHRPPSLSSTGQLGRKLNYISDIIAADASPLSKRSYDRHTISTPPSIFRQSSTQSTHVSASPDSEQIMKSFASELKWHLDDEAFNAIRSHGQLDGAILKKVWQHCENTEVVRVDNLSCVHQFKIDFMREKSINKRKLIIQELLSLETLGFKLLPAGAGQTEYVLLALEYSTYQGQSSLSLPSHFPHHTFACSVVNNELKVETTAPIASALVQPVTLCFPFLIAFCVDPADPGTLRTLFQTRSIKLSELERQAILTVRDVVQRVARNVNMALLLEELEDENDSIGKMFLFPSHFKAADFKPDSMVKFESVLFKNADLACPNFSTFQLPLNYRLPIADAARKCSDTLAIFPSLSKGFYYMAPDIAKGEVIESAYVMRITTQEDADLSVTAKGQSVDGRKGAPDVIQSAVIKPGQRASIVMQFFSVHALSTRRQHEMAGMLAKQLEDITNQQISQALKRNVKTISDADNVYLRPPGQPAALTLFFPLPCEVLNNYAFLVFLKQNLNIILDSFTRSDVAARAHVAMSPTPAQSRAGMSPTPSQMTAGNIIASQPSYLQDPADFGGYSQELLFLYNHLLDHTSRIRGDLLDRRQLKERLLYKIEQGIAFISASLEYTDLSASGSMSPVMFADYKSSSPVLSQVTRPSKSRRHSSFQQVHNIQATALKDPVATFDAFTKTCDNSGHACESKPGIGLIKIGIWPKYMKISLDSRHPLVAWLKLCARQVCKCETNVASFCLISFQALADYMMEELLFNSRQSPLMSVSTAVSPNRPASGDGQAF